MLSRLRLVLARLVAGGFAAPLPQSARCGMAQTSSTR
jgi:hypothetical protein